MGYFQVLSVIALFALSVNAAVPASFETRGLGGGGALFSPSINPADDNEYYVACDMSELFHTTDFGASYELLPFRQIQGGNYAIVRFTNNPNLRYAINQASDLAQPVKSRDGGITWQPLPGNPDISETTYSLFVDYNRPERIIIGYYGEIHMSRDSGATFTSIHAAANSGAGVVLGGAFFDGNNIYLGTSDGLLVSFNGGASFAPGVMAGIPSTETIFSFAGAKAGNVTRLFCLTSDPGNVYPGVPGSDYWGFVKNVYSFDSAATATHPWVKRLNGIDTATDFVMFVGMADNNINTVYLAGSDDQGFPNIMKTTDAGANWTHVFIGLSSTDVPNQNVETGWEGQGGDHGWGYGECAFGVAVAPQNVNKVIYTDFGFVHKTSDGGATWQQAYVLPADQHPAAATTPKGGSYHSIGLENTSCWQVLWADSLNLFSAYSDIGAMRSTDGGKSWSFNFTGFSANTMYRIAKAPSGTLYAGTSNIHDMYASTRLADNILNSADGEGKVIFSTDKGASWQLLHLFSHPVFWVALDPNDANTFYASVIHSTSGGVFVSHDIQNGAASTWAKLPNPPRTEGHPACLVVLKDGSVVATYSGHRTTAFTASSGVFIYSLSGSTWTDVSDAGMQYWTKDIIVDPNDVTENTWYVCVFSGWGGAPNGLGGIYRTTNRGQNWTKTNSLDRVTSLSFVSGSPGEVYATTETEGLWHCPNAGAVSPVFTEVAAYPFRQPERVFFNPYVSTEMWIGGFGGGMRVGSTVSGPAVERHPAERMFEGILGAGADHGNVFVKLSVKTGGNIRLSLYDINGRRFKAQDSRALSAGIHNFRMNTGILPSGHYILKVKIGARVFAKSIESVK